MYQGETIKTTITGFPIPTSEIQSLYIVFKNNLRIVLEKTLTDCVVLDDSVEFKLTQEESLSLSKGVINRSVVVVTKDGSRFESCPSPFTCGETVKKEVLA